MRSKCGFKFTGNLVAALMIYGHAMTSFMCEGEGVRVRGFPITTSITSPIQCKLGRDAAGVSLGEMEHLTLFCPTLLSTSVLQTRSFESKRNSAFAAFITSLQREETADKVNAARERGARGAFLVARVKNAFNYFLIHSEHLQHAFNIAKVTFCTFAYMLWFAQCIYYYYFFLNLSQQ